MDLSIFIDESTKEFSINDNEYIIKLSGATVLNHDKIKPHKDDYDSFIKFISKKKRYVGTQQLKNLEDKGLHYNGDDIALRNDAYSNIIDTSTDIKYFITYTIIKYNKEEKINEPRVYAILHSALISNIIKRFSRDVEYNNIFVRFEEYSALNSLFEYIVKITAERSLRKNKKNIKIICQSVISKGDDDSYLVEYIDYVMNCCSEFLINKINENVSFLNKGYKAKLKTRDPFINGSFTTNNYEINFKLLLPSISSLNMVKINPSIYND